MKKKFSKVTLLSVRWQKLWVGCSTIISNFATVVMSNTHQHSLISDPKKAQYYCFHKVKRTRKYHSLHSCNVHTPANMIVLLFGLRQTYVNASVKAWWHYAQMYFGERNPVDFNTTSGPWLHDHLGEFYSPEPRSVKNRCSCDYDAKLLFVWLSF